MTQATEPTTLAISRDEGKTSQSDPVTPPRRPFPTSTVRRVCTRASTAAPQLKPQTGDHPDALQHHHGEVNVSLTWNPTWNDKRWRGRRTRAHKSVGSPTRGNPHAAGTSGKREIIDSGAFVGEGHEATCPASRSGAEGGYVDMFVWKNV